MLVPEELDKVVIKGSGKVKDRFIFDLDADFTPWELSKFEKFKKYAETQLVGPKAWMLKEFRR